ncbi:hypothetical protein GW17_00009699 [Ensete ventricosum]|nr:hypothetical protein GW17_00009699 [Ensete ventricosum]
MGESPFSLAFDTKAILSPEVVYSTLRVKMYDEVASNKQLCENLDLLEEKWVETHLRTLAYKKVVTKLYNCKMCPQFISLPRAPTRGSEWNPLVAAGSLYSSSLIRPEKEVGRRERSVTRFLLIIHEAEGDRGGDGGYPWNFGGHYGSRLGDRSPGRPGAGSRPLAYQRR